MHGSGMGGVQYRQYCACSQYCTGSPAAEHMHGSGMGGLS